MASERDVLNALRNVIDPDLGRDIVSLGFVKDLTIEGGNVSFTIELTTPACPVRRMFQTQSEQAVQALPGVESVHVTMSAQAPKHAPTSEINGLEHVNTVLAVSSCKGGVGKSTVAAHLARAMVAEGLRVGLLDTDVYGPSMPTIFNLRHPDLFSSENMLLPVDVEGLKLMSLGFLLGEAPAVLRGPLVSSYTQQILRQTMWGALDYLIIDTPPGTGDIQLTIVQQAALDGAIIVTTPQALSLVDVARGIMMFEKVNVPVLGIVENMSYFTCDQCGKKHRLFGASTQALKDRFGLDTLAEIPIMPGISSVASTSEATEALMHDLATRVHCEVGKRRVDRENHPAVTFKAGVIRVAWPDGTVSALPAKAVRLACRCAHCVDETTSAPLLDPDSIPDDIAVESVAMLGNYAVSIAWNDGHSTGIYAWEVLRGIAEATKEAAP